MTGANMPQKYFIKESIAKQNITLGFLILGVGLLMLFTLGYIGSVSGFGILMIVIGFMQKNRELLTLHDDHLEMKLTPLAKKWLIRYDEIKDVYRKAGKVAGLVVERDGEAKKVRIDLGLFRESEREDLLEEIEKRVSLQVSMKR